MTSCRGTGCAAAIRSAVLVGFVFAPSAALAVSLGDVAAALAAPSNAPAATNDWSAFAKLKGAKWQGSAPKRGGNAWYWNAKVPIDGVGSGGVSLVGGQQLVQSATVEWPRDIALAKVPDLLKAQFPADTKFEVVRGACADERLSGSRIYRATLAGRKPLYLHIQFAAGDRGGNTSTIEMEPQRNKGWIC